ncbi:MazG nucleotide pyrophosphohydrolase domain-containing protein [Arthrobacter dokdonensis]|uniref:MazG nucleotide pyrophosphohydrolase domain-containing protein n=1 Tax=Arthrobacter dokdonellae TaxID=2211210 RepID=UPI001D131D4D|nr:MazG nucleotide pyrophosphohydrolase domain-containing protein [Arthrobacter dokdonellae]
MDALARVVAELREHCLWTAALTHRSLIAYLVEESYELADVVEAPGDLDVQALKGELGDILYQVVLHALLQTEGGGFTLAEVADQLREKLIRRNSHVFRPDGTLQARFPESMAAIERNYAAEKDRERPGSKSVFDSLPASMPALALAAKTLERAGDRAAPGHLAGAPAQPSPPATEEELGELLFDVVRAAQARGLDAERALRTAVRRYQAQRP